MFLIIAMPNTNFRGGKIVSPIREMMLSKLYDGVIFYCSDKRTAKRIRIEVVTVKIREHYNYFTHIYGTEVWVLKERDAEDPYCLEIDLRGED